MSFELFIGRRYLRTKQKHAFISLITILSIAGVTVGVMALIVVIAVMSGFENDLKNRILGVESHVVIMRSGEPFGDYRTAIDVIEKTKGVVAATPFIHTQIMLRSQYAISGAILRGIDPETAGRVIKDLRAAPLKRKAAQTKIMHTAPGIILGKELAKSLSVIVGDAVYLISSRGIISPFGHLPAMKRFQVAGFFESGMYEYDGAMAYIVLADAQKLLQMKDTITGVEVRVDDIYRAPGIAGKIIENLGLSYWAKDWMHMNKNLFSALKLEKTVMFIILVLIILVAAFNIASSLIMMVMEKTRDIAILKAMGATRKSIRKIFVFKGLIIGFVGTVLGVGLGFILCMLLAKYKFIELPGDVYYITTLPVRLEALDVLLIASASMVISYLSTLYPARQASKLNPVEAIRYG